MIRYTITGKTPCKYGPVFALCLYCIESNYVNTVQKQVCIYMAFFLCMAKAIISSINCNFAETL